MLITCDLQGNCVLLIIDAHHNLTAVQTRVTGTKPSQSKTGIVAVDVITRQCHTTLEGLLHLRGERWQGIKREWLKWIWAKSITHQADSVNISQLLLLNPEPYLDHIVFSHENRLLLLQAIWASLAPDLGPLDPGGLMGWTGTGAEGEEAGEENGFGHLLTYSLMGHFPHIHHSICIGYTWGGEERRGESMLSCKLGHRMLFLVTLKRR